MTSLTITGSGIGSWLRAGVAVLLLATAACTTTDGNRTRVLARTNDFLVVQAGTGSSAQSLAAAYLGDARSGPVITDANKGKTIVAGAILTVPLKPINRSGIFTDGYQTVPILCYHQFGSGDRTRSRMEVSENNFRRQLQFLKDNEYRVIPLADLPAFLNGDKPIPENAVVITIDDGYRSAFSIAYPLLREFDYPATVFIYSDFIGGRSSLNWQQMTEMKESGLIDIQSHSRSHPSLSRLPDDTSAAAYGARIEQEVSVPDRMVRDRLGFKMTHFAYPFGDTSEVTLAALDDHGYELAVTVQRGGNASFTPPLLLRRNMVFGDNDLQAFRRHLTSFRKVKLK